MKGRQFISGAARLAGVIGWPVSHSRSPLLHGYWLSSLDIDGAYVPLAVRPEDLETAVRALPGLGFRGANVTVPHKEAVMALMDSVDLTARRIGAVNTIVVLPDGTLEGRNTDAFGFIENLRDRAPGWRPGTGPAVVIGAGGAARAVVVGLLDTGVTEITIVNRTRARAEAIVTDIGDSRLVVTDWAARSHALEGAGLLVNTTTLGMAGHGPLDLYLGVLPEQATVADIVYTPLETPLLAAARARGLAVVDGLGMLIHQGRPGFAAWFGVEPEADDALRQALLDDIAPDNINSDNTTSGRGAGS